MSRFPMAFYGVRKPFVPNLLPPSKAAIDVASLQKLKRSALILITTRMDQSKNPFRSIHPLKNVIMILEITG